MPTARPTVAAITTGNVPFAGNTVTDAEALHLAADCNDVADILVAHGHRHRDGALRPLVPEIDVHVRAANGGLAHLDHHVVVADLGLRDFFHPDAGRALRLYQCLHEEIPLSGDDAKLAPDGD